MEKEYSSDYHDYVIKDGKLVGQFDLMYKHAGDIPWHQNETVNDIFTDIDLAILKHFKKSHPFESLAEIGCGLGYVSDRIQRELNLSKGSVSGFDISQTAVDKASSMFPDIKFERLDVLSDDFFKHSNSFDLTMQKETLWYVLDDFEALFDALESMSRKYIYFTQTFPDVKTFLGSDIFPDARALEDYIGKKFDIIYCNVEKDARYGYRELVHILAEKRR
jgi:SAM-dependent methyltransferase